MQLVEFKSRLEKTLKVYKADMSDEAIEVLFERVKGWPLRKFEVFTSLMIRREKRIPYNLLPVAAELETETERAYQRETFSERKVSGSYCAVCGGGSGRVDVHRMSEFYGQKEPVCMPCPFCEAGKERQDWFRKNGYAWKVSEEEQKELLEAGEFNHDQAVMEIEKNIENAPTPPFKAIQEKILAAFLGGEKEHKEAIEAFMEMFGAVEIPAEECPF